MAGHFGKLISMFNKMTHTIQWRLKDIPGKNQVAELEDDAKKVKGHYKDAKKKLAELEAEVKRLTGVIADQDLEIKVTKRQKTDLELELKAFKKDHESLIVDLDLKMANNILASQVKEQNAEIQQAVREGKKEGITVYNKVLGQVKEKFAKKRVEGDLKVEVQEIQSNIVHLEEILTKEVTDLEQELKDLKDQITSQTSSLQRSSGLRLFDSKPRSSPSLWGLDRSASRQCSR